MDDSRFDDIIKNKIGEHEEPGFDPAALAGLHHQMAAINLSPWYSQYASQLSIGVGFLLSTAIIVSVLWYKDSQSNQELNEKIIYLTSQADQLIKLQTELEQLKSTKHDTIKVVEIREQLSAVYANLLVQIESLKKEVHGLRTEKIEDNLNEPHGDDKMLNLSGSNATAHDPDGQMIFGADEKSSGRRITSHPVDKKSARAVRKDEFISGKVSPQPSSKTIRHLQKHYAKGIGINLGPTVEYSLGIYSEGSGSAAPAVGLLADFIVSPSFSLETGVKYTHRFYEIKDTDKFANVNLPGLDENLGDLQRADIDNRIIEVPINLKYRYPITLRSHWIGALGYSSLLYVQQDFEYNHAWSGDPSLSILSTYKTNDMTLYPGMVNFSLGFGHELKNKKTLEAHLYYQLGLGNKGLEQTNSSFIGLRGSYWFSVR